MINYRKLPVSVLIMTQNEQENVRYAVESVINTFNQVIITDSFSIDKTLEILKEYPGVNIYSHKFENWAHQRNWMLENCDIQNEKVLFLDADEYLTPAFVSELKGVLDSGVNFSSILITPKFIFMGCWLRYAYGHPKIRRVFSCSVRFLSSGAREYAIIAGPTLELQFPIIHCDHKPLSAWITKHSNNAKREALYYFKCKLNDVEVNNTPIAPKLKAKLWVRHNIWNRLPLFVRPLFYFIYRYFFNLGFLDGRVGFLYCFLHALWYPILIDASIIEMQQLNNEN